MNLVQNPSFELGFAFWTISNEPGVDGEALTTIAQSQGNKSPTAARESVTVGATGETATTRLQQTIVGLVIGTTYTLQYDANVLNSDFNCGSQARIDAQFPINIFPLPDVAGKGY